MMVRPKSSFLTILILVSTFLSCREVAVPKPKGYFRIDLPKKQYITFNNELARTSNMPFSFEYPVYGNLTFQVENKNEPGWFNIEFPAYRAKIYLTYKDVGKDFEGLMEQTYTMNVKNHIAKADAIDEKVFNNEENKV